MIQDVLAELLVQIVGEATVSAVVASKSGKEQATSRLEPHRAGAFSEATQQDPNPLQGRELMAFIDALVAMTILDDDRRSELEMAVLRQRLEPVLREKDAPVADALLADAAEETGDPLRRIVGGVAAMPDTNARRALALGLIAIALAQGDPMPATSKAALQRAKASGSFNDVEWAELVQLAISARAERTAAAGGIATPVIVPSS